MGSTRKSYGQKVVPIVVVSLGGAIMKGDVRSGAVGGGQKILRGYKVSSV